MVCGTCKPTVSCEVWINYIARIKKDTEIITLFLVHDNNHTLARSTNLSTRVILDSTYDRTRAHTHVHAHKAFSSPLSFALWLWFTAQCFSAWTQVSNQRISCGSSCQKPHSNPSHFVHTVAHVPLKHLSVRMEEKEREIENGTERDPGSLGNVLSWFPGWLY